MRNRKYFTVHLMSKWLLFVCLNLRPLWLKLLRMSLIRYVLLMYWGILHSQGINLRKLHTLWQKLQNLWVIFHKMPHLQWRLRTLSCLKMCDYSKDKRNDWIEFIIFIIFELFKADKKWFAWVDWRGISKRERIVYYHKLKGRINDSKL